jgi:hypothetical protein
MLGTLDAPSGVGAPVTMDPPVVVINVAVVLVALSAKTPPAADGDVVGELAPSAKMPTLETGEDELLGAFATDDVSPKFLKVLPYGVGVSQLPPGFVTAGFDADFPGP